MSIISEDQIQILQNLGLTYLQAKCYLNLVVLRKADVKAIAKESSIARQDVYRVMSALAARGLVEEIVSFKAMYKATSIKEGLSILMEKKKKDYLDLEIQTNNAFNSFGQEKPNCKKEDFQFELTSERELLLRKHVQMVNNARISVNMAFPIQMNERSLKNVQEQARDASSNGVKIRVIAYENKEVNLKHPDISCQTIDFGFLPVNSFKFGMHICDKNEMTVAISEMPLPSLWTNSPIIIELASAYFEILWNNAEKHA
jgi:sugar-specific transcriptional regulator TrmB